ncbi:MAG: hypothetical protein PHT51_05285 [Patescibacteria group bacterium]|nr:hypothetical protein [Patescibacteria group bacterium]MDD4611183.1 hypothetical protein [Patescibacteria group bacterium]
MTKKLIKKMKDCGCGCCSQKEEIYDDLHKLGDDLVSMVKNAKNKYEKADNKTKKKVMTGVAGAAALIAGAIGINKLRNKKK